MEIEKESRDKIEQKQKTFTETIQPQPGGEEPEIKENERLRFDILNDLISEDPILSLAGLRIEIENKITLLYRLSIKDYSDNSKETNISMRKQIEKLHKIGIINKEDYDAIMSVVTIINSVVHGLGISNSAAKNAYLLAYNVIEILDYRIQIYKNHPEQRIITLQ